MRPRPTDGGTVPSFLARMRRETAHSRPDAHTVPTENFHAPPPVTVSNKRRRRKEPVSDGDYDHPSDDSDSASAASADDDVAAEDGSSDSDEQKYTGANELPTAKPHRRGPGKKPKPSRKVAKPEIKDERVGKWTAREEEMLVAAKLATRDLLVKCQGKQGQIYWAKLVQFLTDQDPTWRRGAEACKQQFRRLETKFKEIHDSESRSGGGAVAKPDWWRFMTELRGGSASTRPEVLVGGGVPPPPVPASGRTPTSPITLTPAGTPNLRRRLGQAVAAEKWEAAVDKMGAILHRQVSSYVAAVHGADVAARMAEFHRQQTVENPPPVTAPASVATTAVARPLFDEPHGDVAATASTPGSAVDGGESGDGIPGQDDAAA
eukprot:TRINITY_DN11548_c0_g2_i1.p1 TRINITY_DN11548_c0_g2~~TRINITY_DN11548_c0_g2_i1.p1  ORF type:complete len:440 (+),score=-26.57 TRINITY_DN11548_c0_g2_i1:190-1320(+)